MKIHQKYVKNVRNAKRAGTCCCCRCCCPSVARGRWTNCCPDLCRLYLRLSYPLLWVGSRVGILNNSEEYMALSYGCLPWNRHWLQITKWFAMELGNTFDWCHYTIYVSQEAIDCIDILYKCQGNYRSVLHIWRYMPSKLTYSTYFFIYTYILKIFTNV